MQNFSRLLLLLVLVAAPAAFAQRRIGEVTINVDKDKIPIRVSATTRELEALAQQAFGAHGRYKLVLSGQAYDIRFSAVTATQVQVEVTKGAAAAPVAAETVTGTNLHNALLRAADVAVVKTNGLGLRGFFAAKLAFIGESAGKKEIFVSDLFFSPGEVKQVTHDRAQALSPRWSPDGAKLIYTSFYKSGFPDIFQIDLGSYQRTTFVSFRGTNSGARFSPTGRQVAMILTGEGSSEIYISDAQGRQVARKTHSDAVKASPCFSPDGSRLVFTSDAAGSPQLYVMSVAGGSAQRLVTGYSNTSEPDWSIAKPDKIVCTVRAGRPNVLAVYDLSKGAAEVVIKPDFDAQEPSWLADGRHVVYTARARTGQCVLGILDTETGQSKRISATNLGSVMQAGVWTP